MSNLAVAGAGSFGTALAIALAKQGSATVLWARDTNHVAAMNAERENTRHLSGAMFPAALSATDDLETVCESNAILVAVPTQSLREFAGANQNALANQTCVLCCKGIEKQTGLLPSQILADIIPTARTAVLTGPGFASEIAQGLPTALTLATESQGIELQSLLSTQSFRLYLSNDPVGAQLGGALKNVVAIACGIAIGAGLGESARAALMTRGYAEIVRLAVKLGANPKTLVGLSGLGDLALTCTSMKSRNFSLGVDLGQGGGVKPGTTFEGVATARAALTLSAQHNVDLPIAKTVTAVLEQRITINDAVGVLLSRPLTSE